MCQCVVLVDGLFVGFHRIFFFLGVGGALEMGGFMVGFIVSSRACRPVGGWAGSRDSVLISSS